MEDFLKRKLDIGDSIVFIPPYSKSMVLGRVVAFSLKMVRVIYQGRYKRDQETSRKPGELVKVDGPDLTMYLLKR